MKDEVTCGHNLWFKNKYDDSHERQDLTNYGPGKGEAPKTVKQSYSGLKHRQPQWMGRAIPAFFSAFVAKATLVMVDEL